MKLLNINPTKQLKGFLKRMKPKIVEEISSILEQIIKHVGDKHEKDLGDLKVLISTQDGKVFATVFDTNPKEPIETSDFGAQIKTLYEHYKGGFPELEALMPEEFQSFDVEQSMVEHLENKFLLVRYNEEFELTWTEITKDGQRAFEPSVLFDFLIENFQPHGKG